MLPPHHFCSPELLHRDGALHNNVLLCAYIALVARESGQWRRFVNFDFDAAALTSVPHSPVHAAQELRREFSSNDGTSLTRVRKVSLVAARSCVPPRTQAFSTITRRVVSKTARGISPYTARTVETMACFTNQLMHYDNGMPAPVMEKV